VLCVVVMVALMFIDIPSLPHLFVPSITPQVH
jgi:hypothetical protein